MLERRITPDAGQTVADEIEAIARRLRAKPVAAEPLRISQDELAVHAAEQRCIASIKRANRAYEQKHCPHGSVRFNQGDR
jgi:hypothetical protein